MQVHYFAAARAARGAEQENIEQVPGTLGELLERLGERSTGTTDAGMDLAEIFRRCTFLVDGAKAGPETPLAGVARVDVLPPFAGG